MHIRCSRCGSRYNSFESHKCPTNSKQAQISTQAAAEPATPTTSRDTVEHGNVLVGVRIPPEMLSQLDKARGGMTRPEKIRQIMADALLITR